MGRQVKLGRRSELAVDQPLVKQILGRRIMVVLIDNKPYALEGDCCHMRAPLATGKIDGATITCPWHGWRYNLRTGACLTNPGFKLKTWPVIVADGELLVEL